MTRDEAMAQAVECATQGSNGRVSAEWVMAYARLGQLWVDIADRTPEKDLNVIGDGAQLETLPFDNSGDEERVIVQCGHHETAMLVRGGWLHAATLRSCDDPPISKGKDR